MKALKTTIYIIYVGLILGCNNSQNKTSSSNTEMDSCQYSLIFLKNNHVLINFLKDSICFHANGDFHCQFNTTPDLSMSTKFFYTKNDFNSCNFDSLVIINTNYIGLNSCNILTKDSSYLRIFKSDSLSNKCFIAKTKVKNLLYLRFLAHHVMQNWQFHPKFNKSTTNNYEEIKIFIKNKNKWTYYSKQSKNSDLMNQYFRIFDIYNQCNNCLDFSFETLN